MTARLVFVAALLAATVSCDGSRQLRRLPVPTPPPISAARADGRPTLDAPRPYRAQPPEVFRTASGLAVWLVRRPDLPLVAVGLALPVGSADDPPGRGGLAHITAEMLVEGAGDRDAVGVSTAIHDVGASLATQVSLDGSRVVLTVLKKHFQQGFDVFADVVARPHLAQADFDRVAGLWRDGLSRRADDPMEVAGVVARAVLHGPGTPYGRPPDGSPSSAAAITLDDVQRFYRASWRPDRALLVVAGDITRGEIEAAVDARLASWEAPPEPLSARVPPPAPLGVAPPRLVVVDRPLDSPQAVLSVVRAGVAAGEPATPLLRLLNTALGGSFSSRLNQNLREDRGWTYGASSAFTESRGAGLFVARTAVPVNVTAAAIQQMRLEIGLMAREGLRPRELAKVKAQDVTSLTEQHETVEGLVSRLASLANLGLSPTFDAQASATRQSATVEDLAPLARRHLDLGAASVVVVGPLEVLRAQLRALDLGEPAVWTAEGAPL